MVALCQHLAGEHIEFQNAVHLVIKHFDAHSLFAVGRGDNLDHVAAYTKAATLKVDIIAVVLNFHQLVQNFLPINNLT